jgi:hypothetical protein
MHSEHGNMFSFSSAAHFSSCERHFKMFFLSYQFSLFNGTLKVAMELNVSQRARVGWRLKWIFIRDTSRHHTHDNHIGFNAAFSLPVQKSTL